MLKQNLLLETKEGERFYISKIASSGSGARTCALRDEKTKKHFDTLSERLLEFQIKRGLYKVIKP